MPSSPRSQRQRSQSALEPAPANRILIPARTWLGVLGGESLARNT